MAAEVALGVLLELDLVLLAAVERDGALDVTDHGMGRLDPAVEDADADAGAGRAPEGPLPRDALRPVDADRDALAGPGGKAPRGNL